MNRPPTVTIWTLDASELELLEEHMPASRRLVDGALRSYHETRLAAQRDGSADYLIAWLGEEPVGHAFLRWNPDEPFMRERNLSGPLLEALAVRPDMQSRGIGTALVIEAEYLAKRRGYSTIGLAVGTENERARSLYARLEYRESGSGEFSLTWPVLEEDGIECLHSEICTYLVKAPVE